jgi:predicted GNAT superfamily acetyltransferase
MEGDARMFLMAKKKARTSDRHKPSVMVRIPKSLAEVLGELADDNATRLTEEVKRAVREYLERNHRWPVSKPQS